MAEQVNSDITLQEALDLTDDALALVDDKQSPDVTLLVFQTIESTPDLRKRYDALRREYGGVNRRIGWYVKRSLNRETDRKIVLAPYASSLINSYTRFKP